jgi:bifunctional non-homologous end joining protein LigD
MKLSAIRKRLESLPSRNAAFIEAMECLAVTKVPSGPEWVYEIKLDGYRAVAVNSKGKLNLYSRRRKSFHGQYPYIIDALSDLPENAVVDGEVVALDDEGRPNFNLLQHSRSQASRIRYFIFDLLIYQNRDLTQLPFIERRRIMSSVLKFRSPRIRLAQHFETSADEMVRAARQQQLEGVIAKRKDSRYESGKRSGSWTKYRLNRGQELVIGGYVPGPHGLDSVIVGYYRGKDLVYIARVRNGFVPATRRQVFEKLRPLLEPNCPFVNLPEMHKGRWGDGLTAEDMEKCVWVRPELVAQIEFLEWTESDHLRHSKFAGLREDKVAPTVTKEPMA